MRSYGGTMRFNLEKNNFFEVKDNYKENDGVRSVLMYGDRIYNCKFSIMIPTYLRNKYLKETIDSALCQDIDLDYEVVVVDNNDDFDDLETKRLLEQYDSNKVSYYKNEKNLGMFGNWNRCIELANSEWVLILHDDDTIASDYLSKMNEIISCNPNVSCIGCNHNIIDENSIITSKDSIKHRLINCVFRRRVSPIYLEDFYYIHPINIMGLLINRKKAIEVGGFDRRWDPTSDYVFILNLAYRYSILFLEDKLLNYRVAVNASLTLRHLIGMVEVDAYMRQSIYEHIRINSKIDSKYRAIYSVLQQDFLISSWTNQLMEEDIKILLNEYDEFNNYMKFTNISDNDKRKQMIYKMLYLLYIRYLRKCKGV